MIKKLLDYQVLEKLGESIQADVYKVLTHGSQQCQVVKKIKPQFCSAELIEYLQQQINQLNDIQLSGATIPQLIHPNNEIIYLLQPWTSGKTLVQWLKERDVFILEEVLNIIIAIAEHIEQRHKAGYIHKSIKPSNIWLDETLQVRLLDDVHVLDINQMSHFIYEENFRIHALPYLSPEQTGRIKHTVNYATDLYSLGMVFFECLTGTPPFLCADPIAIIHSHLAEIPPLAQSVNPDVPEMVSKIVEELLKKPPEKRYQTASGLLVDLKQCLNDWQQHHFIARFGLKQHDFSNRITIPSLMVGRDEQKKTIAGRTSEIVFWSF